MPTLQSEPRRAAAIALALGTTTVTAAELPDAPTAAAIARPASQRPKR